MSDTDTLISAYEQKLQKSITTKALEAAAKNKAPQFSREEMAYLNTKADKEENKELEIETPTKEFVIKKGSKVLNVNTELFNKMNARCPEKGTSHSDESSSIPSETNNVKSESTFYPADHLQGYGTEYGPGNPIWQDPSIRQREPIICSLPGQSPQIQSVNKNAYEIRLDVLAMALDWVKWSHEQQLSALNKSNGDLSLNPPTHLDAVEIARKFYSLVENRR